MSTDAKPDINDVDAIYDAIASYLNASGKELVKSREGFAKDWAEQTVEQRTAYRDYYCRPHDVIDQSTHDSVHSALQSLRTKPATMQGFPL